MSRLRVVHWGTGNTGRHGLRAIIEHPALELVGLHVHSADKVGRDAGEICGLASIGIVATDSLNDTLALQPDCLSYMANGLGREEAAVADIEPFLRVGVNVVTCSLIPLLHPASAPAALLTPIEHACQLGRVSLFNSGIDPGYATSQLAASVLSICTEIECVRVQELGNFRRYGAAMVMREIFGFGQPSTFIPPLVTSGMLQHFWTGTLHELATLQQVELDDISLSWETDLTHTTQETAFGTVPAGSIGAIRFELTGKYEGRVVAVVEHVDRIAADVAPQWPKANGTDATAYRIEVTGRPNVACELDFDFAGGVSGAVVATATFLANAIPTVCAARPGVLAMHDLSPFIGHRAAGRLN